MIHLLPNQIWRARHQSPGTTDGQSRKQLNTGMCTGFDKSDICIRLSGYSTDSWN